MTAKLKGAMRTAAIDMLRAFHGIVAAEDDDPSSINCCDELFRIVFPIGALPLALVEQIETAAIFRLALATGFESLFH